VKEIRRMKITIETKKQRRDNFKRYEKSTVKGSSKDLPLLVIRMEIGVE